MTPADANAPPDAEELSALCDGEAAADHTGQLLRQWSTDPAMRQRWHDYALVGDVLRSSDLAAHCQADGDFVARLRQRMDAEGLLDAASTHVPADADASAQPAESSQRHAQGVASGQQHASPAPAIDLAAARARRNKRLRRWSAPVGIAAGVVLVAGVVLTGRAPDQADSPSVAAGSLDTQVRVIDRNARHDPRFDAYLAAHKQFQPAVVLAPSSGLLRNATYDVSAER
ncbi:MAG: sigma-E factor negative regulatory protein [Burkholderiales bacterium]|nr:sigma-E factor negative regulatory protein [Burkholderiales bacterium]